MPLEGKVAIVTGAGRRVGQEIARALGARRMRVAVHYFGDEGGARYTAAEVTRAGGEARLFRADLSQPAAPAELVDAVADSFHGLDVLVNSAAIMLRTPVGEVTTQQWDTMFAINLRAPFFAAQAAARRMSDGGAIVNIADLAALETWPNFVPHGTAKAGVVQMTRGLAHALAPRIRVNAIAPGVVLLPEACPPEVAERLAATTPLRRIGSPADVAQAVIYLLDADFVTGHTLVVDGGRYIRK